MKRKLFPRTPNLTLASHRQIGRTATRYAAGRRPTPVPVKIDSKMHLIVHATTARVPRTGTLPVSY
jgi:hypothetical protein